jgi:hypothetical protein
MPQLAFGREPWSPSSPGLTRRSTRRTIVAVGGMDARIKSGHDDEGTRLVI